MGVLKTLLGGLLTAVAGFFIMIMLALALLVMMNILLGGSVASAQTPVTRHPTLSDSRSLRTTSPSARTTYDFSHLNTPSSASPSIGATAQQQQLVCVPDATMREALAKLRTDLSLMNDELAKLKFNYNYILGENNALKEILTETLKGSDK